MTQEARWGTLLVLLSGAVPAMAQYPYPQQVQYYYPQPSQIRPYSPPVYAYPQPRPVYYPQQTRGYYPATPTYYGSQTYVQPLRTYASGPTIAVSQSLPASSPAPTASPIEVSVAPPLRLPRSVPATTTSTTAELGAPVGLNEVPYSEGADLPVPAACADGSCSQGIALADKKTCPAERAYFFADYLYMTVGSSNLPFAQVRDGVTITAVPRGEVRMADPNWDHGIRVGGGVRVGENSFLQGSFLWYENDSRDRIVAPTPFVIHSLVTFPGTLNTAATSAAATSLYTFDLRLADATFKHVFCRGENYDVAVMVGGRYAHLDQDFASRFQILGETAVDTSIEFNGGGPGVGLEGDWRTRCGLFAYGRGMVHLLLGHFDARYEQRNTFVPQQALVLTSEDRVVPQVDLEAGVGWMSPNRRIRLSGGFYLNGWYNTITTSSLIQGVRASNFTTNGDNYRDQLFFNGLTTRLEFRF